jgi:hypothetical protein
MKNLMEERSRKVMMSYFILFVLLAIGTTCEPKGLQTKQSNSLDQMDIQTRAANIKQQWEARLKELDLAKVGKDYPARRLQILRPLLADAPDDVIRSEFERIRSSPTDVQDMSEYDLTLLQEFVGAAVKKGDRDKLVYLLSAKCPPFIGTQAIELYLADSSLNAPLIVLFDSYEKATTEQSKRFILEVLNRVFGSVVQEHTSEERFLNASKDWYLNVGLKLKINIYYHPAALSNSDRELFLFEK